MAVRVIKERNHAIHRGQINYSIRVRELMRYSAEQWKRFLAQAVNMKIRLNFDISETLSSPRPPWALIQARKPYNVHERPINRQHYNRTSCHFRSLFIDATDQRRAARNIEEFEFVLLLLLDEYEDLRGRFRKFCFFLFFFPFFILFLFFILLFLKRR